MECETLRDAMDVVSGRVVETLPGRRSQVQLLSALLGKVGSSALPALFLYGHTATGKSTVTKHVLRMLQHVFVSVSCVECYTSRLIYKTVLGQLSRYVASHDIASKQYVTNHEITASRCDNMNEFILQLKNIVGEINKQEQHRHGSSTYILFERSERLIDLDPTLLPSFLRLQELSGLNTGVILESEIVWEKFRSGTGVREPIVIHFTDYSKDELCDILCLDDPGGYPAAVYRNYVELVLSVFYIVCHNLNELRYQASINFPRFIEPVVRGEVSVDNTHKLWRNIEPHLRKSLLTVYLRETATCSTAAGLGQSTTAGPGQSIDSRDMRQTSQPLTSLTPTTTTGVVVRSHCARSLELPVYSKYLLIAAYLASYNPAKTDKRFFVKLSGKRKKRALTAAKKRDERTTNQMLGPKFFPLDRLMAIFYSIVDGRVAPTANIFCQLSSLVTLGLLTQAGGADSFDCPKYKCLVSLDLIKSVARTVGFEVMRYIYDFV